MSVCVLGSLNQDLIAQVSALPRPGETVAAHRVLRLPGGKGANQAIAAARMGAAVRMLGAVGADDAGDMLLTALAGAGVAAGGVRRIADVATGAAYITTSADGENQIVVAAGTNACVVVADAVPGDAAVLLAQLETPIAATAAFFAAGAGRTRILNTAPALPEAAALFEATDLLILNQTELAAYLHAADLVRAPEDSAAARRLFRRAGQRAVVTLGAGGAVLVEADAIHVAPAFRVSVVDTTGAGDCFCGALAALIDRGLAPADALATANAAAALSVQREGAGSAMPSAREVERLLAERGAGAT